MRGKRGPGSADSCGVMQTPPHPIRPRSGETGAPRVARPVPRGGPLSADDLRLLSVAEQRGRKIRRAAGVARFSGWSLALCAGGTALFGFMSLESLVTGGALAWFAYVELTEARKLGAFDLQAPRRLAWNQLGLCGAIIVYSLWNMFDSPEGVGTIQSAMAAEPAAADLIGDIEAFQASLMYAVYGSLIVASIIAQGATAWYYNSRGRHVQAYVAETPSWIVDLQRASSGL